MFYTQSIFSSPRFIPSPYFIPSPQSVVCSPQSIFYTDRIYIYIAQQSAWEMSLSNLFAGLQMQFIMVQKNNNKFDQF